MLHRISALALLAECTGDDLWSIEYCRQQGVPDAWIEELADGFESNFQKELQSIYVDRKRVNQYEGIRDVDLACKLGEFLGIDVTKIVTSCAERRRVVREIREAIEEE